MKIVGISKCISGAKRFVGSVILGLLIGLFPLVTVLMYMGVILLMIKSEKYGGGYVPFVLAGVIAAIAGLALTIAHIDKDFEEAKQNLIRVGELYAAAAVALIAFGLLFPVYDSLAQPSDVYYIPFLFAVLTLFAFSLLSGVATYRFIAVLWKKRKAFLKDSVKNSRNYRNLG